jgi:type II secretory pathway pseudopilin PulG
LLVVISIIALVIALLLPALNKARAAGQDIACSSDLRQVRIAIQSYEIDFGVLPLGISGSGKLYGRQQLRGGPATGSS